MAYPEDDYSADIDFVKRYGDNPNAPDTTPPNVAPVPARAPATVPYPRLFNPTGQDALMGNVNAAARATTLPGVGQPGSTDITDQTNLNVAAAMERADLAGRVTQPQAQAPLPTVASIAMDEYGQQRQMVDQQRAQIMARLGIIPPQQAGLSAVVLASPHERVGLLQNLSALEAQSDRALREHHYAAVENARQVHEQTALQTGIQIGTGKAKMLQAIQDANLKHGVGTPEAANAIISTAASGDADIQAALGHKALDALLKPYTNMHDLAAERAQFVKAFGREPSSIEKTSTGGVLLRADQPKGGAVPAAVQTNYATLKANQAEQQAYLDREVDPAKRPALEKNIAVINAQLGAVEQQFPSLNPKQTTGELHQSQPALVGQNAPTVPSTVPAAAQRKAGTTYPTPKGNLKWTGTGWVNP